MPLKKAKCIRVPIKDGEDVRKYLSENNFLREDLKISKDDKFIYFPLKDDPSLSELKDYSFIGREFQQNLKKVTSYKDLLRSLPENLKNDLPTSFDIIGDIALIKLSGELLNHKTEIGKALLNSNKHIKVVCLIDPVEGELRTRPVEIIAGEKRTKTTHKEYGLDINLDIERTYYSPRLAQERKRVSNLVEDNERIVDMFAGVAPFSIMIAKNANPKMIYAIDKNKDAIEFAKQNVKRNKVLDKIELICSDAKSIPNIVNGKADRIIMNLPFSAYKFFDVALEIANDCCVIHYYDIIKEEKIDERTGYLKKIAKNQNFTLSNLVINRIKTYAPREFYMCIDITAEKMPM